MLTSGQLMRLTKHDFIELIKQPTLRSVSYAEAQRMVMEGAVWLDVRFPDEHKDSGIQGSLNMPLHVLEAGKLEDDKNNNTRYVVYCDTGDRSSLGAFLLTQRGFDACYLADGLLNTPYKAQIKIQHKLSQTPQDSPQEARTAPRKAKVPFLTPSLKKKEKEKPPNKKAENLTPDTLEADIRVSALKADLAKATMQLEEALRLKSEAEVAKQMAQKSAADQLRSERKKIESEAVHASQALKEAL